MTATATLYHFHPVSTVWSRDGWKLWDHSGNGIWTVLFMSFSVNSHQGCRLQPTVSVLVTSHQTCLLRLWLCLSPVTFRPFISKRRLFHLEKINLCSCCWVTFSAAQLNRDWKILFICCVCHGPPPTPLTLLWLVLLGLCVCVCSVWFVLGQAFNLLQQQHAF